MMLSKEEIIQKNIIREYIGEKQFQPAGVDLTLKEVYRFAGPGKIDFDNSERKISEVQKIEFENDEVKLMPGAYKVIINEIVSIPKDTAGLALPRSSMLRCGVSVHTALWDPGYEGRSEFLIVVHNPNGIVLKRNARIAQLILYKLSKEVKEGYSGTYHKENIA